MKAFDEQLAARVLAGHRTFLGWKPDEHTYRSTCSCGWWGERHEVWTSELDAAEREMGAHQAAVLAAEPDPPGAGDIRPAYATTAADVDEAERHLEHVPVIGGDEGHYLYAGFGERIVLVCEHGALPRWRGAYGLTSAAARSFGRQLLWLADRSEEAHEPDTDEEEP